MGHFIIQHKFLTVLLLAVVCGAIYFFAQIPSNDRQWNAAQTTVPHVQLTNDGFSVQGVRDFRYGEAGAIISTNYIDVSHQFADLKQVWYGISHFGGGGLAHAFLSYEFNDGEFLVMSIEARLEKGEDYSPVKGVLRRYEKLFIFGTEADIIGLRSHSRHERVLLYPLTLEKHMEGDLLKDYLREAQGLETSPKFYNTLVDNCLTGLLKSSGYFSVWDYLTNIHIILPGRSDSLAQELGLLDQAIDLEELRRRAMVDPLKSDPADVDFSREIRVGWGTENQ